MKDRCLIMRPFNYSKIKEEKWDSEIPEKQDIRELCLALSVSSIEGSLRKLVAEGELRREGRGKSTFYVRLK